MSSLADFFAERAMTYEAQEESQAARYLAEEAQKKAELKVKNEELKRAALADPKHPKNVQAKYAEEVKQSLKEEKEHRKMIIKRAEDDRAARKVRSERERIARQNQDLGIDNSCDFSREARRVGDLLGNALSMEDEFDTDHENGWGNDDHDAYDKEYLAEYDAERNYHWRYGGGSRLGNAEISSIGAPFTTRDHEVAGPAAVAGPPVEHSMPDMQINTASDDNAQSDGLSSVATPVAEVATSVTTAELRPSHENGIFAADENLGAEPSIPETTSGWSKGIPADQAEAATVEHANTVNPARQLHQDMLPRTHSEVGSLVNSRNGHEHSRPTNIKKPASLAQQMHERRLAARAQAIPRRLPHHPVITVEERSFGLRYAPSNGRSPRNSHGARAMATLIQSLTDEDLPSTMPFRVERVPEDVLREIILARRHLDASDHAIFVYIQTRFAGRKTLEGMKAEHVSELVKLVGKKCVLDVCMDEVVGQSFLSRWQAVMRVGCGRVKGGFTVS